MHRADLYLLKNTGYFFALANIVGLFFPGWLMALWCNAVALAISLALCWLIRLTIRRYAAALGMPPAEVKQHLADYIADEKRGKGSFFDYLQQRIPAAGGPPLQQPGTDHSR